MLLSSKILKISFMLLIAVFGLLNASQRKPLNLMPVPKNIKMNDGKFRINNKLKIEVLGECGEKLLKYSTRTLRRLDGRTGLFFEQDFITSIGSVKNATITINSGRVGKVILKEDESYTLEITSKQVKLKSATDIGAMRGLETLLQLLSVDDQGYYFPAVKIEDEPRFPWRGLMIDASRHFQPIDVMKRNLEAMAAVKMNVLHWHLADDQGFRVECKTFPKLHLLGSDGVYYTQVQIKEIIKFAHDMGIRVVPEFDVPAHATSWIVAYPELASSPDKRTIERRWGIMDPTINPTDDFVYIFLDKFFEEMSELFTDDYIHIGGDENNGKTWDNNEDIQKFMKDNNIEDNHALQAYFNKQILKILTKYDKTMMGWDEILHPQLPKNSVIHSWRGIESLVNAAQKGYMAILSNGYYIDLIHPTTKHYLNDPIPADSPLTDSEKKFILGGEATMWSEFVTPETIDSRIWPRTAAIAERFWSPGSVKDIDDMYRRLDIISYNLEELGITHIKNYRMMLRRLTNNNDILPLKTLIDVIEPVKIYQRNAQFEGTYTSHSPLTRVVDAARPDQQIAREFNKLVDGYNRDQGDISAIKNYLKSWKSNHIKLERLIKKSPILKEIQPISKKLEEASTIGLQAIEYIESNKKPSYFWNQKVMKVLKDCKKPVAQTEIMVITGIEKLVQKAGK